MKLFEESLIKAPIVKKGDYPYVIHPITDGIPEIQPRLLEEITVEMKNILDKYKPFDKIVTMEAMGIPLAVALSLKMNIPFTIIRKRSYGLNGEIEVSQITGYSKSKMYINGLKKGDKIVIVDDVLSTGGTLKAVLQSLKTMGVDVKKVVIALDKGNAAEKIAKEIGISINTLIHIDVKNDEIIIG